MNRKTNNFELKKFQYTEDWNKYLEYIYSTLTALKSNLIIFKLGQNNQNLKKLNLFIARLADSFINFPVIFNSLQHLLLRKLQQHRNQKSKSNKSKQQQRFNDREQTSTPFWFFSWKNYLRRRNRCCASGSHRKPIGRFGKVVGRILNQKVWKREGEVMEVGPKELEEAMDFLRSWENWIVWELKKKKNCLWIIWMWFFFFWVESFQFSMQHSKGWNWMQYIVSIWHITK